MRKLLLVATLFAFLASMPATVAKRPVARSVQAGIITTGDGAVPTPTPTHDQPAETQSAAATSDPDEEDSALSSFVEALLDALGF